MLTIDDYVVCLTARHRPIAFPLPNENRGTDGIVTHKDSARGFGDAKGSSS